MLKNFKLFLLSAVMIFSVGSYCSAAETYISQDNLTTYIEKCNQVLKTIDANSSLDMPKEASNENDLLNYIDKIETESKIPIEIFYTVKDDKMYTVALNAESYNNEVRKYFDHLCKIYLQGLGLTDEEATGMLAKMHEKRGRSNFFVQRLNCRLQLSLYGNNLLISARDK